jgi:hypothetical protein
MDVQILLDALAKQQGDVTKAIDSILCHGDNDSSGVPVQPDKPSFHSFSSSDSPVKPSSQVSLYQKESAFTRLHQSVNKSFQESCYSPTSQTTTSDPSLQRSDSSTQSGPHQRSFQMTLEPAVALHLLELFGPIDGINLEGNDNT